MTSEYGIEIHWVRHRRAGNTDWVRFYPLFSEDASLESAHRLATKTEKRVQQDSMIGPERSAIWRPGRATLPPR
jgi:hypothetical protein